MRDLRCQVTSSLLRFPNVTIEALGEDEITLDSVLHGRFTVGAGVNGLAWLACGPQLEVVQAVTGERLSAYCFSGGGGGEHPPSVLAARPFTWLKRSGLLVGLEEGEGSMLCLYDLAVSRVVKAVVIPGRITAIEPLVSYGGASASTQHLHQSLRWFFGVAAVVTDLGHVLLVDLCLDDLECSQSELEASDLEVVSKSPGEIPRLREMESRQGRHLCLQLSSPTGTGASALQYVPRTNQLAVGFSDGNLQLWNMKTLKKEYHSQLDGGRVPVYAFTFQEPENDPRNCCYLWAVQSAQDHEGDVVSLHLLQLAFSERKCLASGKILYEGLEYCEERYSQDLSSSSFPHRAQTSNTRLLSCQTIEKFRHHPDREDSVNEVASPDTSVAVFCWQVKAYGQANPSTYVGVFDINRWYHAQMPDSLRVGESLRSCPYLAVWSLDPVVEMTSPCPLLDVLVHDRSLSRGMSYACPAPEQFFSPTTYNFDATCLLNSGIVHLTCSGHQKETLSFLKKAAPFSGDVISSCYSRCLMSGLLSARLTDVQPSSLSQEEQLDAILSTAVETSSLGLITSCIKHWTAEDQPGSALNLRHILEWAWDKVVHTKEELDGICAPLFDSSSNFTDPQTLQLLQHSQRLLGNLSTIFHCLLNEARELTERGVVGLMNKNLVSSLISQYAQVVLWFCRTGLLPEGSDEDAVQISRPFYSHSVIKNDYASRREELHRRSKGKWCADCLMIDGLVAQCGERLVNLWKRDEGGTGQYPPPTLHALLDTYLLEDIDESAKHAIVIYLLLDVMYSFPNKSGASVESFPTAFAVPIGLVKLVQGLWLLDHHDHQSSLELLLHPATPSSQWAWQHQRVLQALMIQGQHAVALRYLHATRPPVTTTAQATLCLSVLLHNRCLVEAWALLRQHSNRLNVDELRGFLFQSCQELGLVADLLKLPLGLAEQECLVKFLQGTGGLLNRELLMVHYLQQANYIPALQLNHTLNVNLVNERDPKLKERSRSRNSILDLYGKVLPRVQRKLAMERAKPYQHPATIHREVSRPQPLSTIVKRSANGKVLTRAAFISNVLTKIEEVWVGRDSTPQCSPLKSPTPKATEAFVGTPVTMTTKRKSRLLDLVVYPSSQSDVPQNPLAYFSPPRRSVNWAAPRSINRASELNLLQTPQVVKRARALAASGPVFSSFTPQSILRSSLRPTPVATPSASPARSLTPPLRPKESRITFVEEDESPEPEKGPARWSNGIVADSEMSLLARGSPLPKSALESWATHTPEEEEEEEDGEGPEFRLKFPVEKSPHRRGSESGSSAHEVAAATGPPALLPAFPRCLGSVGPDTSRASLQSADTSLEFHDAPLPDDPPGEEPGRPAGRRDEEVGIDPKALEEQEVPPSLEEEARPTNEQSPLPPLEDEECQQREAELDELTRPKLEKEEEEEEEGKEEGDPLAAPEVNDEEVAERASVEEEQVAAHHEEDQAPEEEQEEEEATVVMEVCVESGPSEAAAEDVRTTMEQDQTLDLGLDEDEDDEEPSYTDQPTEEAAAQEQPEPAEQAEPMDPAEDLTEFVEKHLFGNDLSPPLTRSGIHEASNTWTSCNSEPVCDIKEEESSPLPPSVQTSRRADASVASSDPTGTDSHSVVSLGDTEDLSSAVSDEREEEEEEEEDEIDEEECDQDEEEEEEEEDDDDDEEEEEEEDSGSEVEIIEEVQGNGGLSRLQADAHHFQDQLQPHPHHTPVQSELSSAVLSLVTSEAELMMVEGDMEGEVVMMALETGAVEEDAEEEEEGEEEEGGGVCYSQLKPSTTLLVPLELVGESEQDPVRQPLTELSDAGHGAEPDASPPDAPGGFSLRLETEDADCEADAVPLEGVVPELPNHLPATPPADAADTSVEALEPDTLDGIELDVSVVPIMPDLVPFTAEETNNLAEMDPAEIAPAEMDPADIAPAEIDPADIAPADIDPAEMDMASVEPAEDGEPQREDGGMRPDVIPELSPAPREEEEESTCSDRVEVAMETEEQNHREEDEDKIEEEEKEEVGVKRGEDEMLDEEEDEKLEEEEEREEDEKLEEEEERGEDEKLEEEEERGEDEKLEKEEEERGEEEEEERDEEEQTKTSAPAETLMEETIRPGATETGQKVTPSVPAEENETCETAGQEAVTLDAGDTQSQMTSSDTQSQMTSSDAQSKMTSSDTQSKMTSSDTQSKMTSSDTLSEMTSSDTQSKMTSSDTLSEMTSSDTQSKMTSSDAQAEMTSSHIQPETTSLDTQREMTSSDIQRETTSSDTQPETTSSHIQEMTSSDTQPETTSSHIQPETTSSDAQPEMTYSDTQPETTSSDTQQPEEQQEHESHPMTHLPLGEEEEEEEQVKMAPSTPARRATRGRKRVTFPSPLLEPEMGASTGEEDSRVPATPSRVTRSGRHGNDSRVPLTPRPRTPRKAAPRPPPQETTDVPSATEEEEGTADAVTPKPTPSKQRAAQKAIPKKGTRKTRNSVVEEEVEVEEEKMEEEGVTLETAALVPVTRRKTRSATKTPDSKTAPTLPEKKKKKIEEEEEEEEEEEKPKELKRPPASRPGRTTRKSSQADVTLNLYPQEVDVVPTTPPRSRRKTSVEGTAEKRKSSNDISVVLPAGGSRRPTRGNLWSHQEEELLLLDTPLEVDSATPVADALIQRLREEEAREEEGAAAVVTETARVRKRGGKPSAPRAPSPQATGDPMVPEADEGSPVRDSFIYTPPRRRTRGRKAESLDGREAAVAPVTRTRRPAASTVTLEGQKVGDGDGRTEIMKPKTTRRMTTKPKVAPSTRFPVAVDLLSPLPSPAEPAPRAQTRVGDNDAPVPRMNLRRKRVMESIFPKPVTRRKKL